MPLQLEILADVLLWLEMSQIDSTFLLFKTSIFYDSFRQVVALTAQATTQAILSNRPIHTMSRYVYRQPDPRYTP